MVSHLKERRPQVVWFSGLSGSGKTTLSEALQQELLKLGRQSYILDGDKIRKGLCRDLGFSEADRRENIRRVGEVAKLMADAGLIVLAAFITPFEKDRQMLRELLGDELLSVFVDCPLEVCENRDVKGLYKKARAGEIAHFTGISSPFERPQNPDIIVESHKYPVEQLVEKIVSYLISGPESPLSGSR